MNKKVVFIADFFADEVLGGGELNNEELIKILKERGWELQKIKSQHVNTNFLLQNREASFIVSNFIGMDLDCKEWLIENGKYCIYEHDHKYVKSRNPAIYKNYMVPDSELVNYHFYKNAVQVFCQSEYHKKIVLSNLQNDNITSLGGNIWSNQAFDSLSKLSQMSKADKCSVMKSHIAHKNTIGAINYCKAKNEDYDLVESGNYIEFLQSLGKNKKLVFLPKTPETLSRIVVECRMMGMSVTTNELVGATSEDWFSLKGLELIERMKIKKDEIVSVVEEKFLNVQKQNIEDAPIISVVSTFYKGEKFLEGLLEDIVNQTIFDKCELVLVDTASPGKEKEIVEKYTKKYKNIKYYRYEERTNATKGTNTAIKHARGKYVTIANIDDRRHPQFLEKCLDTISVKGIDLVYADSIVVSQPNLTFDQITEIEKYDKLDHSSNEFSKENMIKCLPGPLPFWSKRMHEHCGFFDEEYKYASDWLMWLQFVDLGAKFKKINEVLGIYLEGGASQQNDIRQRQEEAKIFFNYSHIFGYNNFKQYEPYFSQFIKDTKK